jgi:hypothetical protein
MWTSPDVISQIRAVLSSEAEANFCPSGEKATALTES